VVSLVYIGNFRTSELHRGITMIARMFSKQKPVTLLDLLTAVLFMIYVPINYNSIWFVIGIVLLLVARKWPQLDPVISPLIVGIVFTGLLGLSVYRLVYATDIWVMVWSVALILILVYGLIRVWVTDKYYQENK